jgi:hypothetical protein
MRNTCYVLILGYSQTDTLTLGCSHTDYPMLQPNPQANSQKVY